VGGSRVGRPHRSVKRISRVPGGPAAATFRAVEAHRDEELDSAVEVEIRGLSIYTHHGVTDAEQEVGQRLEIDITLAVADCDATVTDRLEDTVDYSEACDIVALAATERSYRTLERVCQVIGERLMERFRCEAVRVRAAKPEPPLPLALEEVAVEVTQERPSEDDSGE
jgi:dihydroneopterin aldolase